MKKQSLDLLRRLAEAHGVAGYEDQVREIFRESVAGPVVADRLGSVYVRRAGRADQPVVMLAAHLDEVGFAVQSITAGGYIRVVPLGGMWSQAMPAQRVRILTGESREVIGVVASQPVHLISDAQRNRVTPVEELLVDIGARSAAEARDRFGVRLGQPIAFDSAFLRLPGTDLVMAKALDNRVGVAVVIAVAEDLAGGDHPNTVYCGATCQEELHARGARTSARLLRPDVALVVEGVPADDYPGFCPDAPQGAMGGGVQVRVMDGSAIMNRPLNALILEAAGQAGIPCQPAVRRGGGTDAGAISLDRLGVPVAVLGIPVRYAHTANTMVDANDCLNAVKLAAAVIRRLDGAACAGLTGS